MNEEEQASQEESQGTAEQEETSTENSPTEENSDKGETNNSSDEDTDEPTPSDNTDEDGSEDSDDEDTTGTGSPEASTGYEPDLMLESRNRKLLYDKFIALRDILYDISNLADDLLDTYENTSSSNPTLFTSWKNASYISNTSQEKIEQISTILRSDVITKLEIDKLRKIFLALQRITNSLLDLLERADQKINS